MGYFGTLWGHFGGHFTRSFVDLIFTFSFFLVLIFKKKPLFSVSPKAITWGHPLVIVPYNGSVGLSSFDSCFFPISSRK